MSEKEEFKKLIEEVVSAVLKESTKSKDSRVEIPLTQKNVPHMFTDLNQQIEEQREQLNRVEEQAKKFEEKFKLLIKKLVMLGYINLGERRKLLKRNVLTQEALINLLEKKRIVNKRELLGEIKKLRQKQTVKEKI